MIQTVKILGVANTTAINNYCNTLNETTCYEYTGLPNEIRCNVYVHGIHH